MNPVPRVVQVALGAGAVLASLLLARATWSLTTKMLAFVGVAVLVALVAVHFERRLPRRGAEPAAAGEVMPGARGFLADFELAGFRPLGGFRWALRGRLVIESVLAPADRDRYAIVTDRVLELASRFGDRTLITTNSGRAPVPGDILRQVVQGGSPSELLRAHEEALDRLAEQRLRPDRFRDDAEILHAVRAIEERALRHTRVPSLMTLLLREASGEGRDRELGDDDESQRRIEDWLGGSRRLAR